MGLFFINLFLHPTVHLHHDNVFLGGPNLRAGAAPGATLALRAAHSPRAGPVPGWYLGRTQGRCCSPLEFKQEFSK